MSCLSPSDSAERLELRIRTKGFSWRLQIAADPSSAAAKKAAEALLTAIHQEWAEASDQLAMVTRSVGFIYPSDQHDIASTRSFDADNQVWTVTLFRKLSTGGATTDADLIGLKTGTIYNLGFAMHDIGGGHDSHHISLPFALGTGPAADIKAVQVADVKTAVWSAVPTLQTRTYQPKERTWEWLKSSDHPGVGMVGTTHCLECHKANGMGSPLNP